MTPEAVRSAFLYRRRLIHPDYRDSARWAVCWEKAAEFLTKHKVELALFMEAQFSLKKPFPMPTHLYNKQALDRYESFIREKDISANNMVDFDIDFLTGRVNSGFDPEVVLADERSPMSAPGRFLLARRMGFAEIAKSVEERAKASVEASPSRRSAYEQVFGGLPW